MDDALVIAAVVPLNFTSLLAMLSLKSVPDIVIDVPTIPDTGEKLVIVGGELKRVKSVEDVAVFPLTPTVIFPVVACAGTVTVKEELVAAVTIAVAPLKVTKLSPVVSLKLVPLIVTDAPTEPDIGVKSVMLRAGAWLSLLHDAP